MLRKKTGLWITAIALGLVVFAGILGVSLKAEESSARYPNDKANHHPVQEHSAPGG